ncbi:hypothetical protein MN116_004107 [Schistosoma mekongi]|uniref:RING-type E3 ubiquitin transferase n=1 Tax=Schistosoma mekongi TaxID=38744 RepID=A0AAE2D7F2_SCHME|nr:hypothetical protein MN116_004107 [Schistosoma mekongi]
MDLTCSICLNILFKPVHLPCNHQFCKDCIVQAVDFTAYQCPICRYRLSNWLRRVKNIDSAVSASKENEIRNLFPNYYGAKELGMSPSLSEREIKTLININTDPIPNCSAEPGDVHEYYVKEVKRYSHLRSLEEKENEEASLALAAHLLHEDDLSMSTDDILLSGYRHNEYSSTSAVSSSSTNKCTENNCKGKQNKKTLTTLLDYAVDTSIIGLKPEVTTEQVLCDEAFARRLQTKYSKLLTDLKDHKRLKSRK